MHEALGAGIRDARLRKGWRQEDAAASIRAAGLKTWRTGTVGQMEAGLRKSNLDELLLICVAFGVALADLIPETGDRIELAGGVMMSPRAVRALLSDWAAFDQVPPGDVEFPAFQTKKQEEAYNAEYRRVLELVRPISNRYPQAKVGPFNWTGFGPSTDMERHAARRLNVDPAQVKLAASILWDHGLEVERDARIGDVEALNPRSLQGRRGHVTRALLGELADFLHAIYSSEET
jgi:transcriptional regulator with XRE-family HTH domain